MLVSSETKLILMASTLPKCIKSPFAASNHLSFVSWGILKLYGEYFWFQVFFALHGKFGPKIFINLLPRGVGFPYDFDLNLEGVTFLFPFGFVRDNSLNVNCLVGGLRTKG